MWWPQSRDGIGTGRKMRRGKEKEVGESESSLEDEKKRAKE